MFKPRTIEEAQTDYLAALSEAGNAVDIDLSPTSPLYVLARANASIISLQELRLSSVLLANNVLTASSAELDELALSIVERGEATYSTGYVFIPPTSSQITLPVGTIFTELASGLQVVSQEYVFVWMSWFDESIVSREFIKSSDISSLRHGVAISGIGRVGHHIKAISKGNFLPVGISDAITSP
jgi:hypothetical protein